MMKPMLYWSLLLVLLPCLEIRRASEIQFQTLDMNLQYLSSVPVCNRASTTGFKNMASTLEIVHRHNPCAQTDKNQPVNLPSFAKILANDQLRVKSIQARVVKPVDSINTYKDPNKSGQDKRAQIPAQSGDLLNAGDYFVTIGLGTPKRRLSLLFDTGSELTWTQCQPCAGSCYRQNDTIFNPRHSSSYSNISCSAKNCSQLRHAISGEPGCSSGTCVYIIKYGDESFTVGFFAKDKLTVTPTDVFRDFLFGCGQNNSGIFGQADGLLGLGRHRVSFVSQTAKKYGEYFSYCLPPTTNSSGFLAFGKNNKTAKKDDDATMIFTPFVPPPKDFPPVFYFIEITAISVGGKRLAIDRSVFTTAGSIIDSGTVITRLPLAAYNKMSIEFKRQMKELNYTSAPAFLILDTCYHICRHMKTIKVPTVSFTFKGNATIDLDAFGVLYPINSTYTCLAFAGNSDHRELTIFGNTQQLTFEVAYDVVGNKLGFAHNPNCQ